MTTYKGAIAAAVALTGGASPQAGVGSWQTPGYIRGNVRVTLDYYAAVGTEASGSVLTMGPLLEAGTMILGFLLGVVGSTGSLTGSIGDLNSATRYASASTNFATAGTYWYGAGAALTSTGPYIVGTNPTTNSVWAPTATNTDAQIIITTGGATLGASNIFSLSCFYTID